MQVPAKPRKPLVGSYVFILVYISSVEYRAFINTFRQVKTRGYGTVVTTVVTTPFEYVVTTVVTVFTIVTTGILT